MPKIEKTQITCNCFGAPLQNTQKYFLARKRQPQESQSLQSNRRVIKSSEIKNESEGKGQKKSLKKRPGSFVHSDHNYPNSQLTKQQNQIRPPFLQDLPAKVNTKQTKGAETHTFAPKHPIIFKFPQTTSSVRPPTFLNNQKEQTQTKSHGFQFINPVISTPQHISPTKNNVYFGYPQFHSQKPSSQRYQEPKITSIQQQRINSIQADSRPSISTRQITFRALSAPTTPAYNQKIVRSHTQNWSTPEQNPLLIQGFQKLFNNKDDNRNEVNFAKERTNMKPREAQKSRRFQQQQLIGRFAQSEDQDVSESTPSEVIGKGFDRTYQDFIDHEYPIVGEQTKASRSTNTKVSNLRGQRPIFDEHQRTKFGNLSHFTSYDRL